MKVFLTEKDKEFILKIEKYKDIKDKINACNRYLNYLNKQLNQTIEITKNLESIIEENIKEAQKMATKEESFYNKAYLEICQKTNSLLEEKYYSIKNLKQLEKKIKFVNNKKDKLQKKFKNK